MNTNKTATELYGEIIECIDTQNWDNMDNLLNRFEEKVKHGDYPNVDVLGKPSYNRILSEALIEFARDYGALHMGA